MYNIFSIHRSDKCCTTCYHLLFLWNIPHSSASGGGSVAGIPGSRCEDLADGGDAVAGPFWAVGHSVVNASNCGMIWESMWI